MFSRFLSPRQRALPLTLALTQLLACAAGAAAARAGEMSCGDGVCCDAGSDCCDGVGCSLADACGLVDSEQFWFRADYLLWQITGSDLPPLVTSSPAGTPLAQAGTLGDPSTTILAGNDTVSDDYRSGFALSGGYLLDRCTGLAIIADYFNAGRDSYEYSTGPNTGEIIARPYFDAQAQMPGRQLVDVPAELAGNVRVRNYEDFQGAGLGLQRCLWNCCDPCGGRETVLMVVGGYRYYQHDSSLTITENLQALQQINLPLVPGTTIDVTDRFSARNEFHGGEIGLAGRIRRDCWWFDGLALLAIGGNRRQVDVNGSTVNTVPGGGAPAAFAGGVYTSSATNIGSYDDTEAAVIPRFRLGVGRQLNPWMAARFGYNVIIWDDVAQAAAHLPPNLAVDPRNIPPIDAGGGPDPRFPGIQGTTVVAHGFDAGLEIMF